MHAPLFREADSRGWGTQSHIFIHMNSSIALFAKSGIAAILKNLASFKK